VHDVAVAASQKKLKDLDKQMSELAFRSKEVTVPSCLAVQSLPRIDFADAFACPLPVLPSGEVHDLDALARAIITTRPGWVDGIFKLRDLAVRPLRLKTARTIRELAPDSVGVVDDRELRNGSRLGFFRVIDRAKDDLLLGEDDSHLVFRASVQLTDQDTNPERDALGVKKICTLTFTTTVQFKNRVGRLYFVPVKPGHKLIVPAMMNAGLRSHFEANRVPREILSSIDLPGAGPSSVGRS
jgi:Protein of unknown function (DUF2867)